MQHIITLSNGKKVANFSSPHPFTFTDGTVLPAIDNDESKRLEVIVEETIENDNGDVSLAFSLSTYVKMEMGAWMARYYNGDVNVVICPLMMLIAIVNEKGEEWLLNSPFRGIRLEDRIKKLASIDKQCLAKGQC